MPVYNFEKQWRLTNSEYKSKEVSTWITEIEYAVAKGAEIRIWRKTDLNDLAKIQNYPHMFPHTEDRQYMMVDQVMFISEMTAKEEYGKMQTVEDIKNFMRRYK